ncbi:flavoprotein, partial [Intestinibacter sp.]|uniref:flavoprotein n=1 Tax=Intestinibacter sp. TaxID=1965304 RepID=UPI003F143716
KKIVIGVTACSPGYKVPDIIKKLRALKADVSVIMTENSTNFVAPLSLQHSSGNPVEIDAYKKPIIWEKDHVSLSRAADLLLIAPASANILGKAANGIADDLLSTTIMSTRGPKVIATHINPNMYASPAVQRNIKLLKEDGFVFVDNKNEKRPSSFPEIDLIIETVLQTLKVDK